MTSSATKSNNPIILLLLLSYLFGSDIPTYVKTISQKNADNTFFSNMIEALDGGYIICGFWEKYDLSSLNLEKNYESDIAIIIEKYNNKENFTDCNDTKSICDGDDNWDENLGNRKWDPGEVFEDLNNNGKYDGLTDEDSEKLTEYWVYGGSKDKKNANKNHIRKSFLKKIDDNGNIIWEKEYDFDGAFPYVVKGFDNYLIAQKLWHGDAIQSITWQISNGNYILTDINGEVIGEYAQNIKEKSPYGSSSTNSHLISHPIFSHNGMIVNVSWTYNKSKMFHLSFSDLEGNFNKHSSSILYDRINSSHDDHKGIYNIINLYDGGYLLTGFHKYHTFDLYRSSQPDWDTWIIKTDMLGNVQSKRFVTSKKSNEQHPIVYQTEDGGFLVGGWTGFNTWKSYIIKTDNNLIDAPLWEGNKFFDDMQILDFSDAVDNGYIVTGRANIGADGNFANSGYIEFQKVLLMHLNLRGTIDWYTWVVSPDFTEDPNNIESIDSGESIFITNDGGYLIVGETILTKKLHVPRALRTTSKYVDIEQTKIILIKTDSSGKIAYSK